MHIFPLSVVGKGRGKRRVFEKRRMGKEVLGKELLLSEWFRYLLSLHNSLMDKGLFEVNIKCLYGGESYWEMMMMMMIKIKIISAT